MSKYSTILNKNVSINLSITYVLSNLNIVCDSTILKQKESRFTCKLEYLMLKHSTIQNQTQGRFTCKLEYLMSKYSTILNKNVSINLSITYVLSNLNIVCDSTILKQKESRFTCKLEYLMLKHSTIQNQTQGRFTCKLEYLMSKYITILNKKRVDLLVNWNILCRNTVYS